MLGLSDEIPTGLDSYHQCPTDSSAEGQTLVLDNELIIEPRPKLPSRGDGLDQDGAFV
jgi:hypothetical protein